jgi:hypothetical protein
MDYLSEGEWKKVLAQHSKIKDTGISEKLRVVKKTGDAFGQALSIPTSLAWQKSLTDLKKVAEPLKKKHLELAKHLTGMISDVDKRLVDQAKWVKNRQDKRLKLQQDVSKLIDTCDKQIVSYLEAMRQFFAAVLAEKKNAGTVIPALIKSGNETERVIKELFATGSMLAPDDKALDWNHLEYCVRVHKCAEAFVDNAHHAHIVARMHTDLTADYNTSIKGYFASLRKHCV